MRVLYTPDIFALQRVGGISRYFVELASQLNTAGHQPCIVAGLHRNVHVRACPRVTAGMYLPFGIGPLHGVRVRFNRTFFKWMMSRHRHAVVHHTFYGDITHLGSRPLVATIHDLIYEIHGERFPRLRAERAHTVASQRAICARADHIIAISETTKNDLIRHFGIAPAKITAIYHGNSMPTLPAPSGPAPPRGDTGEEYLLYVGSRRDYKNFDLLLEAYGRSASLRRRFRLICFGGGPFDETERERIATLGLGERVVQHSGDDSALAGSYRRATAFVYPSLYEGFGLPILEAMSQDCPVLCARAGSMPEIAADAAEYFDPESIESIQTTLERVLADDTRLTALRGLGRQRVRMFSWERCAQETAQVYRRLTA